MVLNPSLDTMVERRFSAGFWAGHEAMDGGERMPVFAFQPRCEAAFGDWWSRHRPDAILTLHEEVKPWLEAMGVNIPGRVALAHLDRHEGLPEWSGMNQNHNRVGAAAIDLLVGKLHRNESGLPDCPAASFVQSTWIDGQTARSLAGSESMPSQSVALA
jgi:hypothetical protein